MAEGGGRERLGRTPLANVERIVFGRRGLNLKIEDRWHRLTFHLLRLMTTLRWTVYLVNYDAKVTIFAQKME